MSIVHIDEYSRKMEKFKSLLSATFEFPIKIDYHDVDKRCCATLQFVLGSYKNKNHSKALNSVIAGYEKRRSRKKKFVWNGYSCSRCTHQEPNTIWFFFTLSSCRDIFLKLKRICCVDGECDFDQVKRTDDYYENNDDTPHTKSTISGSAPRCWLLVSVE